MHSAQKDMPVLLEWYPAGHVEQLVALSTLLYLPAAHGMA